MKTRSFEDCMMMMMRFCFVVLLYFTIVSFTQCDARKSMLPRGLSLSNSKNMKATKKLKSVKNLDLLKLISNSAPYVSSPFSLPPYDSLPPISLPGNSPPYCTYPPPSSTTTPTPTPIGGGVGGEPSTTTPTPTPIGGGVGGEPSTTTPTPIGGGGEGGETPSLPDSPYIPPFLPLPSPPPGSGGIVPGPPDMFPSPTGFVPSPSYSFPGPPGDSPPVFGPSPPFYIPGPPGPILTPPGPVLSPPSSIPSPTSYIPSPSGFVGTPPIFEPPVVYPPPTGPPPPKRGQGLALWCVAKPSVPDPIIQEAMNYACGSGADCDSIQSSGSCFQPDTLIAHASYAFNSYWQRTKVAGGTCDFGGTAMVVTVDPSYDGCHFLYY